LLTVIAIIGILVAITIPVLGYARNTVKRAHSISNLRGIAAGALLYANDNKGCFPYRDGNAESGGYSGPEWAELRWSEAIEPYLPSRESKWATPSRKTGTWSRSPTLINALVPDGLHHDLGDYGGNQHLFINGVNGASRLSVDSLSHPSKTVLALGVKNDKGAATWYLHHEYVTGGAHFPRPDDHGTGLYFCAFADGHAKSIAVDKFTTIEQRKALLIP
jgi:type II secretory pathway pseudopilin PulG